MSAPTLEAATTEDGWPAVELDELRATIAERLRVAGVSLPRHDVHALAEEILADAVRICIGWMERR